MKMSRRNLLLAGLTTGVGASVSVDHWQRQAAQRHQAELAALAESQLDTDSLLEQAFAGDVTTLEDIRQAMAAVTLTPPSIPYDRDISKLLIRLNKLTTQQYLKGKIESDYTGVVRQLPDAAELLEGYRQLTSFIGEESVITEEVEVNVPADSGQSSDALEDTVDQAEDTLAETVQEVVKLRRKISVYFGFVLTSDTHSLILFRGTQRRAEWLANITAIQNDYLELQTNRAIALPANPDSLSGQPFGGYGRVHAGFEGLYYESFHKQVMEVARQLDPSLPCYISGHSLGGALATLAAFDMALQIPDLRPHLQLYTYASPRVGDPAFVNLHSRLIPNSYRVINLSDAVPLVPPTKLGETYAHVGQTWSFLSQNGDLLPNHFIDIYRNAIDQALETHETTSFTNLSVI